jgi:hypothetical protein
MKGHPSALGGLPRVRYHARLTVSAALVAWRPFFGAPLASRTHSVRSGAVLAAPCDPPLGMEMSEVPEGGIWRFPERAQRADYADRLLNRFMLFTRSP